MMNKVDNPKYFEIIRALHRGGLSLWLNRKALLPMMMIPTVVMFLTLMIDRGLFPNGASPFLLALIHIPADFIIGLFCSLIIFILVSAPRKKDSEKPVMFTLNLNEKKDLFIKAAITHVIFSYFANGIFGAIHKIYANVEKAVENNMEPGAGSVIFIMLAFAAVVYGVRFILLPILIIAGMDIKDFFRRNNAVGFSLPVFMVKMASTMTVGFFILLLTSPFMTGSGGQAGPSSPIEMAFVDIILSFGIVLGTAWAYASLTVGFRQMIEGKNT